MEEDGVTSAGSVELPLSLQSWSHSHLLLKRRGKEGKQKGRRAVFKGSTEVQSHKFTETLMVGLRDFSPLVIDQDWQKRNIKGQRNSILARE